MLFRTHLAFGLFLYLLLVGYLDNWLIVLFGVVVGVILPDLDSCKSRYGQGWYFRPLQWFVKHRGMMHSLLFGMLLLGLFALLNIDLAFGFFLGFLSHLFMDLLTRRGIQLFWPIYSKRIGIWIKTGGIIEDIIFVLLFLSDIGLIIFRVIQII